MVTKKIRDQKPIIYSFLPCFFIRMPILQKGQSNPGGADTPAMKGM